MRIDAHQSFWRFKEGAEQHPGQSFHPNDQQNQHQEKVLQQDYLPTHIEPNIIENGFHGVVAQASISASSENDWLISLKNNYSSILAAVGWIDLTAPNALAQMSKYKGELAGFCWHLDTHANDQSQSDRLISGCNKLADFGFSLDLTPTANTMVALTALLETTTEVSCIINPSRLLKNEPDISLWQQWIAQLPARENLYCQLNGLAERVPAPDGEDDFLDVERVGPYLDVLLERLGSENLIYASGWPYCTLSATYDEVYDITLALIDALSPTEQANVLGDNAARCYSISQA